MARGIIDMGDARYLITINGNIAVNMNQAMGNEVDSKDVGGRRSVAESLTSNRHHAIRMSITPGEKDHHLPLILAQRTNT